MQNQPEYFFLPNQNYYVVKNLTLISIMTFCGFQYYARLLNT